MHCDTLKQEFGVLCCLTTPGLRKDIRRQIRQLYSHKITYVHYNYILSSTLKQDNDSTVRGDGGSRVGEVRAGTTSPMPEHKGCMLQ